MRGCTLGQLCLNAKRDFDTVDRHYYMPAMPAACLMSSGTRIVPHGRYRKKGLAFRSAPIVVGRPWPG